MSLNLPGRDSLASLGELPAPRTRPQAETETLIRALSAGGRLHPKQKLVLQCLNRHRAPLHPECTTTISHTFIHRETGVSLDHIRKNVLKDLLFTGLIAVASRTLAGTIFRLAYEAHIIETLTTECDPSLNEPQPSSWTPHASPATSPSTLDQELQQTQQVLAQMTELLQARQEITRLRFLSALTEEQRHWLTTHAKRRVDAQEGIRFIRDRFPHYQAAEQALIEEWFQRSAYGESVPVMAPSDMPPSTAVRSPTVP